MIDIDCINTVSLLSLIWDNKDCISPLYDDYNNETEPITPELLFEVLEAAYGKTIVQNKIESLKQLKYIKGDYPSIFILPNKKATEVMHNRIERYMEYYYLSKIVSTKKCRVRSIVKEAESEIFDIILDGIDTVDYSPSKYVRQYLSNLEEELYPVKDIHIRDFDIKAMKSMIDKYKAAIVIYEIFIPMNLLVRICNKIDVKIERKKTIVRRNIREFNETGIVNKESIGDRNE